MATAFPSERTAVITGAASPRGIGRQTARGLAARGWNLAILDRDHANAATLAAELRDDHGVLAEATRCQHGLVVVGSHVGLTTRQVEVLRARDDLATIEVSVPALLDPDSTADHLADAAERAVAALPQRDVLVITSRALVTTSDPAANLGIARAVSDALVSVVRQVRPAQPAWIIAKGGITGHDLAVHALGIRRAIVAGQFLPGQISLFTPVDAPEDVLGCPFVAFPGNVGAADTLALVRDLLAAASER